MSEQSADVSRRAFLRAGAGATAVAAGAGTAAAQEEEEGGGGGNVRPEWPSYVDDAEDGSYEDLRGESEVTVDVGPDGSLAFVPTNIWIDPGTTVNFEFVSPGHNVKPNDQPDGGGLDGSEGGEFDTIPEGETYEATLETGGMYTYYCAPHEGQGMKGAVAVGEDVSTVEVDTGGGGGSSRPEVPDAAKSLGIATGFGMAATLGLAYFFIKYGGDYGDYEGA
ncbi:plastocyanin/azurin family copper-binding protein [Halosimplex salinum]|uniref:plastocyanin/azurin family copper-binding protein n=1 Tax=Halosimplex salinum TaxID=1710538 RepID=UPI000F492F0B|nr:plastocyanin/azurin family copper-binding protein [Halosimplex salinum]